MGKNMKKVLIFVMSLFICIGTLCTIDTTKAYASEVDYSAVFNASYYANNYADVRAAFGADVQGMMNHFINCGMDEGRQGSEEFNVYAYRERYPDLRAVYGDNLKSYYIHYITVGKAEGRDGRVSVTKATPNTKANTYTPTPTPNVSYTTPSYYSSLNTSTNYGDKICYIAASGNGTKYHSNPNCSRMNGAVKTTVDNAKKNNYSACSKCY